VPYVKFEKAVRFRKEDLDAFIDRHKVNVSAREAL